MSSHGRRTRLNQIEALSKQLDELRTEHEEMLAKWGEKDNGTRSLIDAIRETISAWEPLVSAVMAWIESPGSDNYAIIDEFHKIPKNKLPGAFTELQEVTIWLGDPNEPVMVSEEVVDD